jgi:hypothetical protein
VFDYATELENENEKYTLSDTVLIAKKSKSCEVDERVE